MPSSVVATAATKGVLPAAPRPCLPECSPPDRLLVFDGVDFDECVECDESILLGPKASNVPIVVSKAIALVKRGARLLFQCNACRKQTSVKAGTIFASSKLPLRLWFKAMYLVTQSKKGISSIELGRRLGVTQTTAWTMKHKLAQVMIERNGAKRLNGNVQMDDAYMSALVGTYRAVHSKHVPRYLAEFEYRFNRRYRLETMIPRLAYVALRTAPMPYSLLKLADVYA